MSASANPLLTESNLPFHYPAFDQIKNADFAPAYEKGMTEHLAEVDAIAKSSAAPTFANTIVALERAGELLGRVSTIFGNLTGCNTNDELQALQKSLAPRLAAHRDAVTLNPALFARIDALFTPPATPSASIAESKPACSGAIHQGLRPLRRQALRPPTRPGSRCSTASSPSSRHQPFPKTP